MIKAVVFDYGKVICLAPSAENRAALAALTGVPPETLDALDREYRQDYDRGEMSGREYYRLLLGKAGIVVDDPALDRIVAVDAEGWKLINPGTAALMRDVKKAGLALGILSNMPHEFLSWVRNNVPLLGEADVAVFSCEARSVKPETAIYERLRAALGCAFGEIVFFDDIPDNVQKAAELGIHGVLWSGCEEAREMLAKIDRRFPVVPD
ncbi:MAG: HAD family phosphatase [Treponema sp.]|jgi:putative hydrolase of the HAD superfamily|nr:HAD family phosphatase [Treponema sp.]